MYLLLPAVGCVMLLRRLLFSSTLAWREAPFRVAVVGEFAIAFIHVVMFSIIYYQIKSCWSRQNSGYKLIKVRFFSIPYWSIVEWEKPDDVYQTFQYAEIMVKTVCLFILPAASLANELCEPCRLGLADMGLFTSELVTLAPDLLTLSTPTWRPVDIDRCMFI